MDRVTIPCPHCRFALPTWAVGNCPRCRRPLAGSAQDGSPPLPASSPSTAFTPYQPPAPAFPAPPHAYGWGTPAPPRPIRRLWPRVLGGVAAAFLALMVLGGLVAVLGRQQAVASPARSLVQEPCAQYRELSIRLTGKAADRGLAEQVVQWFARNAATFDQAASLDPDLAGAASAVHGFNALFADPAQLARTSDAELDDLEEPLAQACSTGPGRA